MIFVLACCVAACFGVSVYLLLSREMKGIAMGVFLLSHGANLAILAVSGSAVIHGESGEGYSIKRPPVSSYAFDAQLRSGEVPAALDVMVDPLPQALILTAIVIGFAVMGLTLTLLVVTGRAAGSIERRRARRDEDRRRRRPRRTRAGRRARRRRVRRQPGRRSRSRSLSRRHDGGRI